METARINIDINEGELFKYGGSDEDKRKFIMNKLVEIFNVQFRALYQRSKQGLFSEVTGADAATAQRALQQADGDLPAAVSAYFAAQPTAPAAPAAARYGPTGGGGGGKKSKTKRRPKKKRTRR